MRPRFPLRFLALIFAGAIFALLVTTACGGGGQPFGPGGLLGPEELDTAAIPTAPAQEPSPEPTIVEAVAEGAPEEGEEPGDGSATGQTYTVVAGDTCSGIAAKFPGVTAQEIIAANPSISADCTNLQVGQVLTIPAAAGAGGGPTPTPTATSAPAGTKEYTIQPGDTASGIAAVCGISLDQLAELNGVEVFDLSNLVAGETLLIPETCTP